MTTPQIVLAILFVVFIVCCVAYVTRFKARQRNLGMNPAEGSTESGIAAAVRSQDPRDTPK